MSDEGVVIPAPFPRDERQRQAAVERLGLLDSEPEERFDRLVDLVSIMLDTPIALVSLVHADRQWFKARVGLEATETSRDLAFCAHAIAACGHEPFVVRDALVDPRFDTNPLVVGDPAIRFYAGQVLHDRDGFAVGTLCAIDRRPRELTEDQHRALRHLAKLVEQEFELCSQRDLLRSLEASERTKSLIVDALTEGMLFFDSAGQIVEWNPAAERILGLFGAELRGRASTDLGWRAAHAADGSDWPHEADSVMVALRTGVAVRDQLTQVDKPDGTQVWLRVSAQRVVGPSAQTVGVLAVFADTTAEIRAVEASEQLQAALRRSELTARVALDALEQGVIFAAGTGEIHGINLAAHRILGYSGDELTALWRSADWVTYDEEGNVLPPERRPIVRAIQSGEHITNEIVGWRHRSGHLILLRVSCVPNAAGSGGLVIAFTDVTVEHRARRLLDTTLQTAPVGLAVLDSDRRILRCNPAFAAQAGRDQSELIGTDAAALLVEDDRPDRATTTTLGAFEHQVGANREQRVARPDGSELWVSTRAAPVEHLDQRLTVLATFDITEHRRMMGVLSRFGLLFRHANDVITVVDTGGYVLYASPSTRRVLGYPDGYVHPDGFLGMVHPEDSSLATQALHDLANDERHSGPFVLRMRTTSGDYRDMEHIGVSLLDEPAVKGIVLTSRDITERERLSRELAFRASHDNLTELPNRSVLEPALDAALTRSEHHDGQVGVCYIDLDGFKQVNDTHGHAAGDELLVHVARRLRSVIRTGDVAVRCGGDEFVVVLDFLASSAEALAIVERIRHAITDDLPATTTGTQFGVSIGLAINEPGDTAASILKRADAALYCAKATRNTIVVA